MKTTLNSPNISKMTKLGFNLIEITEESKIEALEQDFPPWDYWFYSPVKISNKRLIECWHKEN